MPFAPISSVQSFTNGNAAAQGIKRNPYVASQLLQKASAMAPATTEAGARVQALQAKASEINSWSSRMTGYKEQGRMRRELAASQAAAANAKQALLAQQQANDQQLVSDAFARNANSAATNRARSSRGGAPNGANAGAVATKGKPANNSAPLPAASAGGVRGQIIANAMKMIGTPYAWGGGGIGNRGSRGTGKGTQNVIGVDCSGLTSYVYGLIGYRLPRTSGPQTASGVKTSIANAKPGDLLGWGPGGHVAIYAGNGMMIESPKPGGFVRTRAIGPNDRARGIYAVRLRLPGE